MFKDSFRGIGERVAQGALGKGACSCQLGPILRPQETQTTIRPPPLVGEDRSGPSACLWAANMKLMAAERTTANDVVAGTVSPGDNQTNQPRKHSRVAVQC